MNDLFSLLNQTQCCHFLDPEKHPNMEKRGVPKYVLHIHEMINLLLLQKQEIDHLYEYEEHTLVPPFFPCCGVFQDQESDNPESG